MASIAARDASRPELTQGVDESSSRAGEAVADVRPALLPSRPFVDPDPFRELVYPSVIEAKRAIADLLGTPLGQLAAEERAAIDAILQETLERSLVLARVRSHFAAPRSGGGRC